MSPLWPLLVYVFTTGLGADFQALISAGGATGIDQAGKCTKLMRSKLILAFLDICLICSYAVITLTADRLYLTDHSLCPCF